MKHKLLLMIFLISPLVRAEVLSWPACVEMANKNNSELQAQLRMVQSTQLQEGVADSGFYPSVAGTLAYDKGNTVTAVGTPSALGPTSTTTTRYSATLSASENLFNGLQDLGKVRQAKANTASNAAVLDTVRAKISSDLKTAYQGLLYAKDYETFTGDIIHRREADLNLVNLLFESGRENKGSLLLSKAYLEQARYEALQSRDAHRVASAQLAKTLGLDGDLSFDIQDPVPIQEPPAQIDLRQIALQTPDVRKARADAEAADAGITIARAGFFPTLAVSGNVGKLGSEFWPHDSDRWSVDVSLVFPFFNGGHDYYNTRSAAANWASVEATRFNVNRDLLSKLEQAYTSFMEAVVKFKVDGSFREAAILRAEIARKRYNNGLMTFEDWDIIENDLINRQRTYLQSKRDRVLAEAAWEQAQGKGVIK